MQTYRLAEPDIDDPQEEAAATCPHCGSCEPAPWESEGPTGVIAPDGTAEVWRESGLRCKNCGEIL